MGATITIGTTTNHCLSFIARWSPDVDIAVVPA
jgi:hypothetical protein